MAGIGFALRRVVGRGGNLTRTVQALVSGVFVVAGPWFLTILTFVLMDQWASRSLAEAPRLFQAAVVSTYSVSLVLSAPLQYLFTRLVSDLIWAQKPGQAAWYLPLFVALAVAGGLVGGLVAVPQVTLPALAQAAEFRAAWIALAACLNGLWIAMLFASALQWYGRVLAVYGLGLAVALGLAVGSNGSVAAALGALAAGHGVILAGLVALGLWAHRPARPEKPWAALAATARTNGGLVLAGLGLALGPWVDKFYFWAVRGTPADGSSLHLFAAYDGAVYLANLAAVVGLVYFVVWGETKYAGAVEAFLKALMERPYREVRRRQFALVRTWTEAVLRLAAVQGLASGALVAGAWAVTGKFDPVLAAASAGAWAQLVLTAEVTFLFYLELYAEAAGVAGAVAIVALGACAVHAGVPALVPGAGWAAAASLGALTAALVSRNRLRSIDRRLFQRS